MCNPPEATRHHSLIKLLILLPLRAVYFRTFQCEIPCTTIYITRINRYIKRSFVMWLGKIPKFKKILRYFTVENGTLFGSSSTDVPSEELHLALVKSFFCSKGPSDREAEIRASSSKQTLVFPKATQL